MLVLLRGEAADAAHLERCGVKNGKKRRVITASVGSGQVHAANASHRHADVRFGWKADQPRWHQTGVCAKADRHYTRHGEQRNLRRA